jgi:hypothetical protein
MNPAYTHLGHALPFPHTLPELVESECHDGGGQTEIDGRPEAASGQISLVLDGAVAAHGRHILRHGDCVCGGVNGWVKSS